MIGLPYIPKVEMSADFALQSKKSEEKHVNLDEKILRHKFVNYPENFVSEGIFDENIQCVSYLRFQQYLNHK